MFSFAISFTLHTTILTRRLPDFMQARYQTLSQLTAQIGRGLGPFVATSAYTWGVEQDATMGGVHAVLASTIGLLGLAHALPGCFWSQMYGDYQPGQERLPCATCACRR